MVIQELELNALVNAGITRWEFETLLADRGIERLVLSDSVEDLERQVERLQPRT
jgi:hypothetical protein